MNMDPLLRGIYGLYLCDNELSYQSNDKAAIKALIITGHDIGIFTGDYYDVTFETMVARRDCYIREWIRQNGYNS